MTESSEKHRLTKIYTRGGDLGTTGLATGKRVPKDAQRIEAYGTVDELQVFMGQARDAIRRFIGTVESGEIEGIWLSLAGHLEYTENLLFTVSGDLATPLEDRWDAMPLANEGQIAYLESLIDHYNRDLPPLKDFVLPGGHDIITSLHLCRVVSRRAERRIVALAHHEPISEFALPFMNRLSDAFFVLARAAAQMLRRSGVEFEEVIWRRGEDPPQFR